MAGERCVWGRCSGVCVCSVAGRKRGDRGSEGKAKGKAVKWHELMGGKGR